MRAPSSVRQAVWNVLAEVESPDVELVAARVRDVLADEDVDVLVTGALMTLVSQEMHSARGDVTTPRRDGPSRWSQLRRVALDDLGFVISLGTTQKWVEDCTAEDLLAYAGEQRARAASLEAKAVSAEAYANAMLACGAESVKAWDGMGRPGVLAAVA